MNKWDNSGKVMNLRLAVILAALGLLILLKSLGIVDLPDSGSTEVTAEYTAITTAATDTTEAAETAAATDMTEAAETTAVPETALPSVTVEESGAYTDKEHVALYIRTYGCLPSNFITKKEAEALGWEGGDLWEYADGKSIGGSRFGNYEGLLPEEDGRKYYECDIDYCGGSRSGKRIVYSDDGLIFYTDDHYESFTELYP